METNSVMSDGAFLGAFEAFVEQLVDAHVRGDAGEIARLLERLNEFADELTSFELDEEEGGALIPWDIVKPPGKRCKSPATLKRLLERPDGDYCPGWRVAKLTDAQGRVAFLAWLIYGYSFNGITITPVGVFANMAQAVAAVKQVGITSLEDYDRTRQTKA